MTLSRSYTSRRARINCLENRFDGMTYMAARIAAHISATLFGCKPATLMNLSHRNEMIKLWDEHRLKLTAQIAGIEVFELRRQGSSLILLFYNRLKLQQTVFSGDNLRFLRRFGYSEAMDLNGMLEHLKSRYDNKCPHEIGIFLGIPLRDVFGYLGLTALPCTLCGFWKVYGKCEATEKLFETFRRAREGVLELLLSGVSPMHIISTPGEYSQYNMPESDSQKIS